MLRRMLRAAAAGAAAYGAASVAMVGRALAQVGQPVNGQLGLQGAGSTEMEHLTTLYNVVNGIIIAIAIFVLLLLLYVMYRFNAKSNPTPSRTTHNTMLEVVWTIVPILILVGMAIPSFRLLYEQYSFPKPDITIKATANAWFWEHEYMDQKVSVTSNVVGDEDILKTKIGEEAYAAKYGSLEGTALTRALYQDAKPLWEQNLDPRELAVDQAIAIPVNKVVHLLVTSNDVIHSWTIPSFGVKQQAVPGRIAALWFKPTKVGAYYGQCSVLCGKFHSAMPIAIRVVEQNVYDKWMAALQAKDKKGANAILKADAEAQRSKPVAALSR